MIPMAVSSLMRETFEINPTIHGAGVRFSIKEYLHEQVTGRDSRQHGVRHCVTKKSHSA
jgi:hypothetical protein